jgi:hypothetical protein
MEYPHWLMVAGAVLVVVGAIGLGLRKNYGEPVENSPNQATPTDEPNPERPHRRRVDWGEREENPDLPSPDDVTPSGNNPT